jgi:hypothetical protein
MPVEGVAVLEEEEEELSAYSADDEEEDSSFVESKMGGVGISVTRRDSIEQGILDDAKNAKIIALDVRFENNTRKSVKAADRLKMRHPYRAIFFFTRVPEAIKEWPVNFAVRKGYDSEAAQHLDRISLMILVHDISLVLLKDIYNLPAAIDWERKKDRLLSIFSELRRFYGLLFPTQRSAEMVDKNLARRYQSLRELLAPFVMDARQWTTPGGMDCLPPVQRILFDGMCREFSDLEMISGVEVRKGLADEVAPLKPPEQTVGGVGDEAAADESETFYLNVWFPDRPAEEPWLVVGRAERMLVNLGAQMEEGQLGKSEPVSEEAEETLETVEYVDVLIQCSDADVVPLHSRIQVPPRKENTARFEVTPRRGGEIPLTVVLLVKNDPIHRTHFYFEAKETAPDAASQSE